jgi:hypothetical protein
MYLFQIKTHLATEKAVGKLKKQLYVCFHVEQNVISTTEEEKSHCFGKRFLVRFLLEMTINLKRRKNEKTNKKGRGVDEDPLETGKSICKRYC